MARLPDYFDFDIVLNDKCQYVREFKFDGAESYQIFTKILEIFEEMVKRKARQTTLAVYESGAKGTIHGNLIDFWRGGYFDYKNLSKEELKLVNEDKHYTRIDMMRKDDDSFDILVFKRIRIEMQKSYLHRTLKNFSYLTKVFQLDHEGQIEIVKEMNFHKIKAKDFFQESLNFI